MNDNEKAIEAVTRIVMSALSAKRPAPAGAEAAPEASGAVFDSVDGAVRAAYEAQKLLASMTLAQKGEIISNIRRHFRERVEEFARLELEETGMGRYEDKVVKYHLTLDKTPGIEDIQPEVFSGDDGLTVVERRPFGVAGCILPSTAPVCTAVHNSICMIAAGNTAVLSPHPGAVRVTLKAVRLIQQAIVEAGGPENAVVCSRESTFEKTRELIAHPLINLLVATGGPSIVKLVLSSGKKAVAAGPGNPPVLVDSTADIPKAARDIICGNSFENCLQCIGEKEVFAVNCIADELIQCMQKEGAYLLTTADQREKLTELVTDAKGNPNKAWVGKDAALILKAMGINAPAGVRTIIFEAPAEHRTVTEELLMPILPIVRVRTTREGIERAKAAEGGRRHSAMVHSKDVTVLTLYAQLLETTVTVKNGPSYAGLGYGGEGFTTMTLAGPTGEGITSPKTFTRLQRCCMIDELSLRRASRMG